MRTPGPDLLQDPVTRYLQHGDVRPSIQKLTAYAAEFESRRTLQGDVVAADVYIDLATAVPGQADYYLDAAGDSLSGVIEQVDHFSANSYETAARAAAEFTVMAHLRLFELPLWQATLDARPLRIDYERILTTAVDAQRAATNPRAASTMVEFMPSLLLARSSHRRLMSSLVGRLSLAREDGRRFIDTGRNPNWDCGFTMANRSDEFAHPPAKVQVKTRLQRKQYKPGIIVLKAAECGFANVEQIIDSCLDEAGMPTQYDKAPLLTSRTLDGITAKVQRRIMLGTPAQTSRK